MRRSLSVLSLLSVGLLGAGPVERHDWTALSAGASDAGQGVVVLSHTRQDIRGFTLRLAGSGVLGAPAVGTFALRMGYHGGFGGAELGAGMWLDAVGFDSRASVAGWGGLPEVHAWVSTWPGEDSGAVTAALSGAGLGSTLPRVRGSVGVWATEDAGVPLSARLELRRNEGVWLGGRVWVSEDDRRGMLTVSVSRAGLAAFYARGTAHPM